MAVRRSVVLSVVVVLASVVLPPLAGPLGARPANPGDSKNCTDFPGWNEAMVWFETYQPHYGDVARLDDNGDGNPCESLKGAPQTNAKAPSDDGGYAMLEANGTVFGFGDVVPLKPLYKAPKVAFDITGDGGFVALEASGHVDSRLTTTHGAIHVAAPDRAVDIKLYDDTNTGYWIVTAQGKVHARGAAGHYGDMAGRHLNGSIIAMGISITGEGYWLVGSDGGIFTFGDATFHGSTGGMRINEPVVGIIPDYEDGAGYWLVAADGGLFAFDAPYKGSVPEAIGFGKRLNRPIIGAIPYWDAYLMVGSDGGIFNFSSQPFLGSLGSTPPPNPIVAVATRCC